MLPVAIQDTVCVPTARVDVLTGLQDTLPPLMLYVVVKYVFVSTLSPCVIVIADAVGVMVGAFLSTLTVFEVVDVLPAKSVVVKVITVPAVLEVILVISIFVLECPLKASLPFVLVTVTLLVYQSLLPKDPATLIVPGIGLVLSSLYESLQNDINKGGIILDPTSSSYVRLATKDEITSALSNNSNTPFWTMTSSGANIWLALKDGTFSYTKYDVQTATYYQGGGNAGCQSYAGMTVCGCTSTGYQRTLNASYSSTPISTLISPNISQSVVGSTYTGTMTTDYYSSSYEVYSDTDFNTRYFCSAGGVSAVAWSGYQRCGASSTGCSKVTTYTVSDTTSIILN